MYTSGSFVDIRSHHSEPGDGLSYGSFTAVLREDCSGESWDVVDVVHAETGEEKSVYSFSIEPRQSMMFRSYSYALASGR